MTIGFISGIDFLNMEAMKYYSIPNSKSAEEKKRITDEKILSGDWLGSKKVDGAFYKFIKDDEGNMLLVGRSKGVNGYVDKINRVPHLVEGFFSKLPNGTCILGEVFLPDDEGSNMTTTIMGCDPDKAIERQKSGEWVHYYIFDILAYDGVSYYDEMAEDRFNLINELSGQYSVAHVEYATYFCGQELYDMLEYLLGSGAEGMVILHKNSSYFPGKRPSTTTQKIKRDCTIDCVVIGKVEPTKEYTGKYIDSWQYWAIDDVPCMLGNYKDKEYAVPVTKAWYYRWAGSLQIGLYKDGVIVPIGEVSGIADEVKEHWQDYIGKVVEVNCMEIFKDTHSLRHPRIIRWRDDKLPEECTFDQVE